MKSGKKIIYILSGALTKDKSGGWRTTMFEAGDNFGICGGRLRIIAAGLLFKIDPGQKIIVSGGKGQLKNILPKNLTPASVIKNELISIGLPEKNIIKEEKANNTYQQLKEMRKIIEANGFKTIILISNKYHLARVKAMLGYLPEFEPIQKMLSGKKLKIKSAESIVLKYEPAVWGEFLKKVYGSAAMKGRIKLEAQGAKQIKEGTYRLE